MILFTSSIKLFLWLYHSLFLAANAAPKIVGVPNSKLKPIFLDKYCKFSRTVAKCENPAECDPVHIVVFLSQWTSRYGLIDFTSRVVKNVF
jgi:hypothetical protein